MLQGRSNRFSLPHGRQRGASLVEFALIVPLLFLLILGMVTAGLTLSRENSIENAVREGTRFGAVYPTADVAAYLAAVIDQVEAAATGDLDDGTAGRYICVSFIDATNTAMKLERNAAGTDLQSSGACFSDGRTNEARVQTVARRTSDIDLLVFSISVTLDSNAVTRYEA